MKLLLEFSLQSVRTLLLKQFSFYLIEKKLIAFYFYLYGLEAIKKIIKKKNYALSMD